MIIIAGDSWGCGEYHNFCVRPNSGLGKCLRDNGHEVFNISKSAASLASTILSLRYHLGELHDINSDSFYSKALDGVTQILVFQTEWIRDFNISWQNYDNFVKSLFEPPPFTKNLIDFRISLYYKNLSLIAQEYDIPICIIGGCSDSINIERMSIEYPGVSIACQSFTNLIVNDVAEIDVPVYWALNNKFYLESFKKVTESKNIPDLLSEIDKSLNRLDLWKNNSQWFCDDLVHPNQKAFDKLYNHLYNKGLFNDI